MVLVVLDRTDDFFRLAIAAVGVGRREMGPHLGAINTLPPEGVVREAIGLIPGNLLGEEELNAELGENLR